MTCQWCVHHRRRGGESVCAAPGGDGRVRPPSREGMPCGMFDPRKSCTTCGRRCSDDDKDARILSPTGCTDWFLRKLVSWGGRRCMREQ